VSPPLQADGLSVPFLLTNHLLDTTWSFVVFGLGLLHRIDEPQTLNNHERLHPKLGGL
jgi:hypothetical protein